MEIMEMIIEFLIVIKWPVTALIIVFYLGWHVRKRDHYEQMEREHDKSELRS
jgi:hypothetical protein